MNFSRQQFLKLIGLTGLASTAPILSSKAYDQIDNPAKKKGVSLKIGLASYTTRNYSLEDTIKMSTRLGLEHIVLKSHHLPLDASDEDIKKAAKKVHDAGLNLYGAGVVYMKSAEEVDNAFRYASAAGMKMIVGVPNHDLLPLVEKKVKETNIKMAIHNHGPGDDLYPTPDAIYEKIKDFDKRIGFCIDIGHIKRLNQDPIPPLKKYADRFFDMHLKDVDFAEAKGDSVELGRGLIDIPAVIKVLHEIDYQGVMAVEFEKDPDDVLPGLSECVGYARGVMDSL